MGQADIQFKAFIRFLLKALKEIRSETDEKNAARKLMRSLFSFRKPWRTDLQRTLT